VKNKGCTIAIIVTASFLLITMLSFYFFFYPRLERFASSAICYAVETRIHEYHEEFGEWPSGDNTSILHQLRGDNPEGLVFLKEEDGFPIEGNQLVDSWGHPLIINMTDEGPHVISPGKSGVPGTDDDIDRSVFLEMEGRKGESAGQAPPAETSFIPPAGAFTVLLNTPTAHANLS